MNEIGKFRKALASNYKLVEWLVNASPKETIHSKKMPIQLTYLHPPLHIAKWAVSLSNSTLDIAFRTEKDHGGSATRKDRVRGVKMMECLLAKDSRPEWKGQPGQRGVGETENDSHTCSAVICLINILGFECGRPAKPHVNWGCVGRYMECRFLAE